jgi:integrase
MIHSLARFIGTRSPVHLAWCTELRSIPFKKTAKTSIGYLEKPEIDALLNQPDQRTALGARDQIRLLFLYNSGARADEAAKLTVGDLQLGAISVGGTGHWQDRGTEREAQRGIVRVHDLENGLGCGLWVARWSITRFRTPS